MYSRFSQHFSRSIDRPTVLDPSLDVPAVGWHQGSSFRLCKAASDYSGHIAGYGSVFYVQDRQGDVVHPTAFESSLSRWRAQGVWPMMLWRHSDQTIIGQWSWMATDAHGLYVEGRIDTESITGRAVWAQVQAGTLEGLSIGAHVQEYVWVSAGRARCLKVLDLMEISLVPCAANPAARIYQVESVLMQRGWPALPPGDTEMWAAQSFGTYKAAASYPTVSAHGCVQSPTWSSYKEAEAPQSSPIFTGVRNRACKEGPTLSAYSEKRHKMRVGHTQEGEEAGVTLSAIDTTKGISSSLEGAGNKKEGPRAGRKIFSASLPSLWGSKRAAFFPAEDFKKTACRGKRTEEKKTKPNKIKKGDGGRLKHPCLNDHTVKHEEKEKQNERPHRYIKKGDGDRLKHPCLNDHRVKHEEKKKQNERKHRYIKKRGGELLEEPLKIREDINPLRPYPCQKGVKHEKRFSCGSKGKKPQERDFYAKGTLVPKTPKTCVP